MAEASIDYTDFKPDWWDLAGATSEGVKAEVSRMIEQTFGPGGLSGIEKAAIERAAMLQYDAQQAMKAAAAAALKAASYADVPALALRGADSNSKCTTRR